MKEASRGPTPLHMTGAAEQKNMTCVSWKMSKHFSKSGWLWPLRSHTSPYVIKQTHTQLRGIGGINFCACGNVHSQGFPGRLLFLSIFFFFLFLNVTTIAVCSHKNSAEPHSPHGFVTAHIHSVAKGAQRWQRTKNVQRERERERRDMMKNVEKNKTCGSCFPLRTDLST